MATDLVNSREGAAAQWPDAQGRFGRFGGKYAPETLMPALDELESAWREARSDPSFQAEIDWLAKHYVGRPTPVYFASNLTDYAGPCPPGSVADAGRAGRDRAGGAGR